MYLNFWDIGVFVLFIGIVVVFSMLKSRKETTGEDFFLAGRGLVWWLIGISLIAANISTEQFVGMNGSGAGGVGLAIASYDWIAAITLVLVAIFFLPRLLRTGIYTIPEYLEYRYNSAARGIMSFYMMIIYVAVTISAVLYSGGLTIQTIFGDMNNHHHLVYSIWLIGIIAGIYTTYGGLKAVAWADLLQGSALIAGGLCVLVAAFSAVGGLENFWAHSHSRMHMILERDHLELPWTALLMGIWIPNLYYWGFNQYIAQRTLAARSLKHGQLGVLMAAGIQVLLPLIIVIPGIIAVQLYGNELHTSDAAFPLLIRKLIPPGLKGFIFAAIAGAVISSLASMLNSAATIFTMDLFKRHIHKDASSKSLITIGRVMTVVFVLLGCLIAPYLSDPRFRGIFHYIQDFQGYASPGILACFLFGFFVKRAGANAGVTGLLLNIPVYGMLHLNSDFMEKTGLRGKWGMLDRMAISCEQICFLNKMAITFTIIVMVMAVITLVKPLKTPVMMPRNKAFDLKPAPSVVWIGCVIIIITLALYVIFR